MSQRDPPAPPADQTTVPAADFRPLDRKPSTVFCKICHSGSSCELLIQPCNCRGSVGNVHLSCLERWLNERNFDQCELCLFQFTALHTRRYTAWRSMVVWARNPRIRTELYSDLIIVSVLTAVAVLLITAMIVFMIEMENTNANGYMDLLVHALIVACTVVVGVGYVSSVLMIVGSVYLAWYTWWRNCNVIRLHREPPQFR